MNWSSLDNDASSQLLDTRNLNEYLAAIVESSDDAIITKNLKGIIQT